MLEFLVRAMEKSGLKPGADMKIAIDAASSELYDEASGMYLFPGESRMAERKSGAVHRRWWLLPPSCGCVSHLFHRGRTSGRGLGGLENADQGTGRTYSAGRR